MESWRKVWRDAAAPLLGTDGLLALRAALETNDQRLMQGATTEPPPLQCVQDWDVERACLLGYCGAVEMGGFGPGGATVGQTEEFFGRMCHDIDQRLGEPAGCRWLLNWWDEAPRDEAFAALLEEVDRELKRRGDEHGD